jgi:pimeloyl-ACP methyl ester carboxylesterase
MHIIKTPSFELAVYLRGNLNAEKLALVLPGRLDTKNYPHMRSHVDFLASKGFLALSFDPPGTWESPGDITLYTVTNYLKAINELIEYFGNKPTIVIGHSRGGSMAMLAGVQNNHVTHIIAIMSRSSPSTISETVRKNGFKISHRDTPSGEKKFILPLSYFEDAAQYDMLAALATCTKPKLYILGTKDALVTPETVREIYEKSADPKQLCVIDSDHNYRHHPEKIIEVNALIETFLQQF